MFETYDENTFNHMSYIESNLDVDAIRYRSDSNTTEDVDGTIKTKSVNYRGLQSATISLTNSSNSIDSTKQSNVTFKVDTGSSSL